MDRKVWGSDPVVKKYDIENETKGHTTMLTADINIPMCVYFSADLELIYLR